MIHITHQALVGTGMKANGPPTEVVYDWNPAMKFHSWPETLFVMENLIHEGQDYVNEHGMTTMVTYGGVTREAKIGLKVEKYSPDQRIVRHPSMASFLKSTFTNRHERTMSPSQHHFGLRSCSSYAARSSRRGYGTTLVLPPEPAFSTNILDLSIPKGSNPYCHVVHVEGLEPNEALALYSSATNVMDQPFFFVENDDGSVEVIENRACGTYGGWMTIHVIEEENV